jgi:hypothetical protein
MRDDVRRGARSDRVACAWIARLHLGVVVPSEDTAASRARLSLQFKDGAAQQGDEADDAGASDEASQLIPGVLWTCWMSVMA